MKDEDYIKQLESQIDALNEKATENDVELEQAKQEIKNVRDKASNYVHVATSYKNVVHHMANDLRRRKDIDPTAKLTPEIDDFVGDILASYYNQKYILDEEFDTDLEFIRRFEDGFFIP